MNIVARVLQDWALNAFLAVTVFQSAEDLLKAGTEKFEKGDFKGAYLDYTKALELNPTSFTYNQRGRTLHELKEYKGALADYTKGLAISPNDWVLYDNRGLARTRSIAPPSERLIAARPRLTLPDPREVETPLMAQEVDASSIRKRTCFRRSSRDVGSASARASGERESFSSGVPIPLPLEPERSGAPDQ